MVQGVPWAAAGGGRRPRRAHRAPHPRRICGSARTLARPRRRLAPLIDCGALRSPEAVRHEFAHRPLRLGSCPNLLSDSQGWRIVVEMNQQPFVTQSTMLRGRLGNSPGVRHQPELWGRFIINFRYSPESCPRVAGIFPFQGAKKLARANGHRHSEVPPREGPRLL